ncbi:MAG: oligosaccharide flippase family protein [Ardenticatenaceae bacterium]|nr:oligosaccharide flippase family protein [Ardenticatenaceae bacterium]
MSDLLLKLRNLRRRFLTADLKALVKDSSWTMGGNIASSGLYLVETMLLARYFSQELLGVYFLIISFPELVQQVLDVRVREVMVRYLSMFVAQNEHRKVMALIKLLWLVDFGVASLALLIVALFSRLVSASLLDDPSFAWLMSLYAVGMLFGSLDSASGPILRVFGRFDMAFGAGLAISVGSFAATLIVVLVDGGIEGLIYGKVLVFILSTLVLGVLSLRLIRLEVNSSFRVPLSEIVGYRQEIFRFAFHVNISSTMKTLAGKLDVIIVGAILGPASVSIYKVLTQFSKTLRLLSDPLLLAVYPRFSLLAAQKKVSHINALVKRLTIGLVFPLSIMMIVIIVFRGQLVRAFAGQDYVNYSMIFVIAVAGMVPGLLFFWITPFLLSLDLAHLRTKGIVVSKLIGLIALGGLTWLWGLTGSAIGYSISWSLVVFVNLWQIIAWKRDWHLKSIWQPISAKYLSGR